MPDTDKIVLVVEDDGLIRMDLVDIMGDLGFQVHEAPNADRAISTMELEHDISVLLTDIDMPGSMNGLALANVVSQRWASCKIVVISGRYSPEQGSLPAGALFLSKPVSDLKLTNTLRQIGILP